MEYLEHHGVKGMKWGQRKQRQRTGRRPVKRPQTTYEQITTRSRQKQGGPKKSGARPKTTYEQILAQQKQKDRQREAALAATFGKSNEYVQSQINRSFNSLVAGPLAQQQMKKNFYSWLSD